MLGKGLLKLHLINNILGSNEEASMKKSLPNVMNMSRSFANLENWNLITILLSVKVLDICCFSSLN